MGRHCSSDGRAARNVLNNMLVVFWWWLWWCQQATLGATVGGNLQSPCPDTFQYQSDSKGELYGAIGVFSFDDNIVQLDLELSVGNVVDNYNGEVQLLSSKKQVISDLQHSRPILYKVLFPRWENIPPKVTKITVNNQLVCSGPPIQLGGWVTIVTTINLQHTLRLRITTLQVGTEEDLVQKLASSLGLLGQGLQGSTGPSKNPVVTPDFNSIFKPTRTPTISTANNNGFDKNTVFSGGGGGGGNVFSPNTQKPFAINTIPTTVFRPQTNPFLNGTFVSKLPPNTTPWFSGGGSTGGGGTRRPINSRPTTGVSVPPVTVTSTSANLPFSDVCGVTFAPNVLVVKGDTVARGAFPWLAAMFRIKDLGPEYKCSGSLISTRHVVTAAHCVRDGNDKDYRPEEVLFVLGKLNIRRWTTQDGARMIEARTIHVHRDYKPFESDADIAVVVLNGEITFNNYIKPICLWNEPSDLNLILGQKGKVVGWGKDEHGHVKTEEPKQVILPVVSQDDCRNSAETFRHITTNRTFCAGSRNGSGPCNGDSGSGFVMKRNRRWFLRGVVSISTIDEVEEKCDLSNYVMFTDCTMHKDWLLSFLI